MAFRRSGVRASLAPPLKTLRKALFPLAEQGLSHFRFKSSKPELSRVVEAYPELVMEPNGANQSAQIDQAWQQVFRPAVPQLMTADGKNCQPLKIFIPTMASPISAKTYIIVHSELAADKI
jgi:hypothetical protein